MAVALDASSKANNASASSLTWSHTCTGATMLIVGAGERKDAVSATYNGVAMTALTNVTNGATSVRQFYLANPASGANNVVVTFSGAGFVSAIANSFTGTDTTVSSITGSGSSTSPSVSITTATGGMVVDYVSHGDGNHITPGASQTNQTEIKASPDGSANTQSTTIKTGNGSVTMSYTAGASSVWAMGAVNLTASGGGGGSVASRMSLTGVGA